METSKRARRRKLDTAKTDLKPPLAVLRRAVCPSSEYRKMESEGSAEKYRAVIDGETQDEPVGPRWGKVESALLRRRRSHSPTAPRCLRSARYGRTMRDLRRTDRVSGWHRSKRTYKRKRSGERRSVSSRTGAALESVPVCAPSCSDPSIGRWQCFSPELAEPVNNPFQSPPTPWLSLTCWFSRRRILLQ
jgi:hypothetical protein